MFELEATNSYPDVMKRLLHSTLFIAITALALSCKNDAGSATILEEEEFITVYIELVQQGAASGNPPQDSVITPAARRILDKHGVTVEEFKATVRNYNADINNWKKFFEKVIERMESQTTRK
ncbi:MAG: DUF4296 domain-containing protein [Ignavibacteriae bacterium]|nr:DUF4296 domain-containing protein [Ignavibacteriota bacterium]